MKPLLKIISYLLIGCLAGFIIVVPLLSLIHGESIQSVAHDIFVERGLRILSFVGTTITASLLAIILQLIIHEGGHLVAGLLTGYHFVSFRLLNFTLIRQDGRLQWRNFDLAGTGGQCLLAPPDRPIDQIDTRWYNAGGVLANIIMALVGIILLVTVDMPSWLDVFWAVMVFIGLFYAFTNGIPMKMGGVANDGYNLFQMEKDPDAKRYFLNILKSNTLNQEGVQPKDMPNDLFQLSETPGERKDPMYVGILLASASQMMNRRQWDDAYQLLTEVLRHKDDIMTLYVNEINAMMAVICIATGRNEEARRHYDKKTKDYVSLHAPTQSDKRLVQFAVALVLDNNRPEAEKIYRELQAKRDKFIHQGDVAMTLDLMQWFLYNREERQPTE